MGQDARDSLTLPRQTGEQAAAKFMLELLYAVVWRVHTLDGREAEFVWYAGDQATQNSTAWSRIVQSI